MLLRNAVLLLGCLVSAYGETRPGDAKELEKLQGTWSFVKASGGGDQKKERRAAVRIVFKGDAITFLADDSKRTVRGTYTVDPSKNPKIMDITLDKDGAKVVTLTIYELDGDTLKLCHYVGGMASKERPKELVADKRTVLGTLKREKK
jgi:uncharacterized protein (TIGR03067 family)